MNIRCMISHDYQEDLKTKNFVTRDVLEYVICTRCGQHAVKSRIGEPKTCKLTPEHYNYDMLEQTKVQQIMARMESLSEESEHLEVLYKSNDPSFDTDQLEYLVFRANNLSVEMQNVIDNMVRVPYEKM